MQESIEQLKKLIDQGRYFEAQARANSELAISSDNQIKQLYALALSKSGSPEDALEFMEPVYKQLPDDSEAAGILGSICKELFKKNQTTSYAIRSRDTYLRNFNSTKSFYTGINSASMSAMAGQAGRSREIASEVISLLDENSEDFWVQATLGEGYLLTKNKIKATEFFIKARKLVGNDWGRVTSVHNQLWLLNHFLQVPTDIMKLFSPPGVVAFIGHMIDHPNRIEPRFPASIEQKVKEAIVHSIRSLNAHIGYCSLACGGDILFAEAMAEIGGEVTLFLPFDKDDFIKTSVQFAGENWVNRFHALVERYPVHHITKERYEGLDELFSFQSRIIFGASVLRGQYGHAEPTLLTVLSDVDLKRKEGGTRDTVNLWPYQNRIVNVNPDNLVAPNPVKPLPAGVIQHQVVSPKRAIFYLAYVDLVDAASADIEKIKTRFIESNTNEFIAALTFDTTTKFLLASESEAFLIDFVRYITKSKEAFRMKNPTTMSLHAGPVYYEEKDSGHILSGESVDFVKALSNLVSSGSILVSDYLADLLTLDTKMISLDYGGVFVSANDSRKANMYKIHFV